MKRKYGLLSLRAQCKGYDKRIALWKKKEYMNKYHVVITPMINMIFTGIAWKSIQTRYHQKVRALVLSIDLWLHINEKSATSYELRPLVTSGIMNAVAF